MPSVKALEAIKKLLNIKENMSQVMLVDETKKETKDNSNIYK